MRLRRPAQLRGLDPRRSGLAAAVVAGCLVTSITELLSAVGAIHRIGVFAAWALVAAGGLGWWMRAGSRESTDGMEDTGDVERDGVEGIRRVVGSRVRDPLWLGLGGLIAATGLIALAAPPNTWDSMTYHMGRVAHWAQNGSVAHFATHIPRQLQYPPWAEFAILQLQVLSGGDRLANLVQWGAYVGCIVGVGLIAALLGADRGGQVLAGVVAATLPMALLQASSTQNDLVVSLWLVCLVVFGMDAPLRRGSVLLAGAGLGLAALTKFTGLLFGLPLAAGLVLWQTRRGAPLPALARAVLIAGLVVVALNAGHSARTLGLVRANGWRLGEAPAIQAAAPMPTPMPTPGSTPSGSAPSGSAPSDSAPSDSAPSLSSAPAADPASARRRFPVPARQVNQVWDAPALASNVLRNLGLYLATPWQGGNDRLTALIVAAHAWIGADPGDPATTYPRGSYRGVVFSPHEDSAGDAVHLALTILAVASIPWSGRPWRRRRAWFALLLGACALIFCLVLKWQPWHTRLQLPLFVLAAPLVAAVIADVLGARLARGLGIALLALALPWLLWVPPRPLVGPGSVWAVPRIAQYFANRPDLEADYHRAADLAGARSCRSIGLVIGGNDWDYPFWALLDHTAGGDALRIRHVRVDNVTRHLTRNRANPAGAGPPPCLILATVALPDEITAENGDYRVSFRGSRVTAFLPVDGGPN